MAFAPNPGVEPSPLLRGQIDLGPCRTIHDVQQCIQHQSRVKSPWGSPPGRKSHPERRTGYRLGVRSWQPTDDDIEEMVGDALERLPAPFRDQLGSVAIVIEDEPSPAELASVGAAGLLGLYHGIPRTRLSADAAPTPSKITIFRGPLTRAHPDPASLAAAVAETVYHEIAHHFGISDERLHELGGGGHR